MAIGQQVTKPGMGSGAPAPLPSGGIQGTNTGYVQPGSQFSQQSIQRNAQQRVPFQGQFNGNPRGANNMRSNPFGFQGQGMAPAWSQQTNLGRYRPPTMSDFGGYNSNMWNDFGGMGYNLPGSYGSPLGQGQFAPMPRQFQQYLMGGGFGGMGRGMGMNVNPAYAQQLQYMQDYIGPGMGGYDDVARYDSEYSMGGMPPGKDGNPLPEQPQPAPTWDSPFNRSYNMAALRQMMDTRPSMFQSLGGW